MTGLSWATFEIKPNEMTKVTDWVWKPLPETKLKLYHLAGFMSSTLKDMPKSDFYVFENPNSPLVSAPKFELNVQLSQMIGMASVIAAQNKFQPVLQEEGTQSETMNFAYLRKFLYAR